MLVQCPFNVLLTYVLPTPARTPWRSTAATRTGATAGRRRTAELVRNDRFHRHFIIYVLIHSRRKSSAFKMCTTENEINLRQ